MKYTLLPILPLFVALTSCSNIKRPAGVASGTLTVKGGGASYYASASGGEGKLQYQGQTYPFSISAVGAGGSGAQMIEVDGEVFNLNQLSQFPGNYTSKRSGITIGKGKFKALLSNDEGVEIFLEGETTGLGSNTGISSVTIDLD